VSQDAHAPALRAPGEIPTTPTLAALRRARERQETALRWLQPLGLVAAVFVVVRAVSGSPPPGLHGASLGVSVALCAIAAGAVGFVTAYQAAGRWQAVFFSLFLGGATAIYWLQPRGPGFFGAVVAAGIMARRMPVKLSAVQVAAAVMAIGAAGLADSARHSAASVLLSALGLIAIYAIALLTRRLSEGNRQAERLLAELERTRDAELRAAALAERQRLAREMHDVLAHSLSGLALHLEGARLLAAAEPGGESRLGAVIERAHDQASAGLQEARWAIGMLRGEELPGPDRLEALVGAFESDSGGVHAALTVTGKQRDLSPGVKLAVYRVAQEALTNVRKHASPLRVEVRLRYQSDGVGLEVEDFAATADPGCASERRGGYGLTGMRERAELLGGTLNAGPTGRGFLVRLWVPA
jgi:signal transduction histidine kinase